MIREHHEQAPRQGDQAVVVSTLRTSLWARIVQHCGIESAGGGKPNGTFSGRNICLADKGLEASQAKKQCLQRFDVTHSACTVVLLECRSRRACPATSSPQRWPR